MARDEGQFLQDRLPRLREHCPRHTQLKNADYRDMFRVSRYTAARELRRLAVEEGSAKEAGGGRYLPTAWGKGVGEGAPRRLAANESRR